MTILHYIILDQGIIDVIWNTVTGFLTSFFNYISQIQESKDTLLNIGTGFLTSLIVTLIVNYINKRKIRLIIYSELYDYFAMHPIDFYKYKKPILYYSCDISFLKEFIDTQVKDFQGYCNGIILSFAPYLRKKEKFELVNAIKMASELIKLIDERHDCLFQYESMYREFYFYIIKTGNDPQTIKDNNFKEIENDIVQLYNCIFNYFKGISSVYEYAVKICKIKRHMYDNVKSSYNDIRTIKFELKEAWVNYGAKLL